MPTTILARTICGGCYTLYENLNLNTYCDAVGRCVNMIAMMRPGPYQNRYRYRTTLVHGGGSRLACQLACHQSVTGTSGDDADENEPCRCCSHTSMAYLVC